MPVNYDWPMNDEYAKERALEFKERDPFPSIPKALLSSAEIEDYARVTGMLYPFHPENLKAASYEAHVGGRFIRWDESGEKIDKIVGRDEIVVLPANSISFIQIESKFRLPNYMAIRFNLRITHVHRGILLGTGPLVDPGFNGNLLIPLHNFTASNYPINTRDALIWIEFTKTTFGIVPEEEYAQERRNFREFPREKMWLTPDDYFFKASGTEPIRSSVPDLILKAETHAKEATKSADDAAKSARNISIYGGISAFAVLVALVYGGYQVVTSTLGLVSETSENLARIESDQRELRSKLLSTLSANDERDDTIDALRNQIDALGASIDRLVDEGTGFKARIKALEERGIDKQGEQQ